ncbi:MAG TPA: GNAT family N-acetyltransferase [Solirubrobacteraceae bacterium]|nr:GNAT family N-acetyltransferase [Solirubrobacteraceae bacterium]
MSDAVAVRPATRGDCALLVEMMRELAEFEQLLDIFQTTEQRLDDALFGERPCAEALIGEVHGAAAGYAVFFTTFSTFVAQPGIWLEDVYVRPDHRRAGVATALLSAVAARVLERGEGRLEFSALDWNERALDFYDGLGAEVLGDWLMLRMTGEPLRRLAAGASA